MEVNMLERKEYYKTNYPNSFLSNGGRQYTKTKFAYEKPTRKLSFHIYDTVALPYLWYYGTSTVIILG